MPLRRCALLFLALFAGPFGCADASREPLRATRDEGAMGGEAPVALAPAHIDALGLALVVDVAGEPLVMLPAAPEQTWSTGEPTLVARDEIYVARREAVLDEIPGPSRRQLGERLALFDDHGLRCEAVVDGLALIVRADPLVDTREEWEGKGSSGSTKKATPAEIAAEVWAMNAPELVAHVRPIRGTCGGATFARAAVLSEPTVVPAVAADPATTARAVELARTTEAFVDLQKQFVDQPAIAGEPPRAGSWDDDSHAVIEVVTMRVGYASYAWITIATDGGCGEFNARYGALLREDASASGGFVALEVPVGGVFEHPRALVDFGDGAPTMMFESAMLHHEAGTYRYESRAVWSMECPC